MYRKEATAAAGKICSLSCACGADCGLEHRRLIPLLNSNFTCPLRKYNITDRKSPEPFPSRGDRPVEEDIFYLCADCGNGKVEISHGCEAVVCADERKCLDCPVNMAWEAIQEFRAEASMG